MVSSACSNSAASALTPISLSWPIFSSPPSRAACSLAVARDIAPLKDALQAAIDYAQTFATSPDVGVLRTR